ncbi:hypothetical protein [Meridianimarinicoccus sp. MJW13]|uniref:hypothetical protein n=1 Tax=Meridianimarinicoccus sp. MJW13 TaxID=2720031 RepID=UPI0018669EB0|nr:hypothetical protein [Fluviibacterium sp. MJW13]
MEIDRLKGRIGLAVASILAIASADPAVSLSLEFFESGNPTSLLRFTDGDATDQNGKVRNFQFSSTCTTCPGALSVGGFQISKISAKRTRPGKGLGAHLSFSFEGTSSPGTDADLIARVSDINFYRILHHFDTTQATLFGYAATPDRGNKISVVNWTSWISSSNYLFDPQQVVGSVTATSSDFFDVGSVNAAFASAGNPAVIIPWGTYSMTQTVRIGTDTNVDFTAFASTQAVPLPAALPVLGGALGALGLLGWRRTRST